MCIDSLHKTYTKRNFRVLFVTPYENQVRLIFNRLRELIDGSPAIKAEVIKVTQSPFQIAFKNGSSIWGFTTGAASGSGAASIRGQKADYIFMDEVDYMHESDFDTVTTIAAERSDIGIFMSSTPTGKRGKFYEACVNKAMGYTEHWHPSTHNPNWNQKMEEEFRAQLTEQGYIHEVMAEFGTQNTGVFNKARLDAAMKEEIYHYDHLTSIQEDRLKAQNASSTAHVYDVANPAPYNPFRTVGVDWDKYGASSSIVVLDFDIIRQKFKVIKRIEVPRAEYSYDKAIETIVEVNEIYNPAWIYCDRGSGEYQIERLHMIGDKRPSTGLKNKVVGWQFSNVIDVTNPITKEVVKEPMKPFMVSQLQIAFERSRVILSPFDEVLHKQLVDYEVVRQGAKGPVFSSENEHFVDALALSYLAFVLQFSEITDTVKKIEHSSKIFHTRSNLGASAAKRAIREIERPTEKPEAREIRKDQDLRGDRPTWMKVPLGSRSRSGKNSWSSREGHMGRSMW